jgi:hypothetical protein
MHAHLHAVSALLVGPSLLGHTLMLVAFFRLQQRWLYGRPVIYYRAAYFSGSYLSARWPIFLALFGHRAVSFVHTIF